MGKYRKLVGKPENYGKTMGRYRKIMGKTMGKYRKIMGKLWENIGKLWENYGKI